MTFLYVAIIVQHEETTYIAVALKSSIHLFAWAPKSFDESTAIKVSDHFICIILFFSKEEIINKIVVWNVDVEIYTIRLQLLQIEYVMSIIII